MFSLTQTPQKTQNSALATLVLASGILRAGWHIRALEMYASAIVCAVCVRDRYRDARYSLLQTTTT